MFVCQMPFGKATTKARGPALMRSAAYDRVRLAAFVRWGSDCRSIYGVLQLLARPIEVAIISLSLDLVVRRQAVCPIQSDKHRRNRRC